MKEKRKSFLLSTIILCLSIIFVIGVVPVQADEWWNWSWDNMMTQTGDYTSPTNGWVTLNVTNNTSFAWGDMHFEIWSCAWMGCGTIDNVHFLAGTMDGMQTPDSDRSPFTYNIDNVSVGATLDYYYYSDPIFTSTGNNTGMFKFKVDNPNGVLYTLAVTPSIVPEPVSSTLFIIGGATLGFRRFRKKIKT